VAELVDALGLGPSGVIPVRVRVSPFAQFMFYILNNWIPNNIIFSYGPITLYWYGFFIGISLLLGYLLILKLSKYFDIKKDDLNDLALWLVLFSLIGARVYEIFLEWNYYWQNPIEILKIWQGGLAIHGVIIAGLIVIYLFSKKRKISFLKLTGLIVPSLALGQTIGRFGNWFNQELFGLPSNLPWSIPIEINRRPLEFINYSYFHPTFLYESIGNLIIFLILIFIIFKFKDKLNKSYLGLINLSIYLVLYSLLRFSLEFIKIDPTPLFLGLRWPQIFSLLLILLTIIYFIYEKNKLTKNIN
jgi:phosphatidylglycerol---prolipoprotein diacylglyceryl transferase